MREPLIDIQNLYVWYKGYKGYSKVINGVDLKVYPKEKVGLVGEAGCGKTTLMKAIMDILPEKAATIPQGQMYYQGTALAGLSKRKDMEIRQRHMAMVFQEPAAALNPVFTIGVQMQDVLQSADRFMGIESTKKERLKRAGDALAQVYIPDPERILQSYPHELSGGMKQRVCIAMAMMCRKDLMIADEPGTALDVTIQAQVYKLLNQLHDDYGMSLIMVSHSLGVARELTDRIYVMYAGNIAETGNTPDLFRNPLHPYTKGLLNAVPKLTGEKFSEGIYGYIPDYHDVPAGCRFCSRCPYAKEICRIKRPAMKEVEAEHFTACFLYGEEAVDE